MKHKSGINDLYIINSYNTILYCTQKKKNSRINAHVSQNIINHILHLFFSTLTHFEHVAWHGYSLALHISKKTISLFQNSGQWGNPFGTQRLVHLGSAWAVTTFIIFCWTVCFFFFLAHKSVHNASRKAKIMENLHSCQGQKLSFQAQSNKYHTHLGVPSLLHFTKAWQMYS